MSLLREYAASLAAPPLPLGEAGAVRYDEVVGPDGLLRPSWKGLAAVAFDLTRADLDRIDVEIAALLADDGVTYAHPSTGAVPWRLDPMPLVLDAPTWTRIEVGLAQRAELMGLLVADLYGPQRLLAEGIVPAAVVRAHSGFIRPVMRPGGMPMESLVIAGADLGRDADGEWHVLADRLQAPSGLGYALQNRRVISRVLPELYRQSDLHRIAPYFSALRSAVLGSAPPGVTAPRVVVLSPGTHSETAFDQAFLANTLGFPLVQGDDLVVHRGRVWMKPSGFPEREPVEPVDVVLRRVDADWCDPLELRGESQLGVTGLLEAARRGTVRVVNGLGAGVLENPGLMPFLPAACELLLGEQLRLPSAPTWWCGTADGLEQVLDLLGREPDGLIVRAIDATAAELADAPPERVRDAILAAPHRYVGQRRLPLSQVPTWGRRPDDGDEPTDPQSVVLRTFAIREGSAYRPLVGGLATLSGRAGSAPVTKDVWVLKADPADPDQGLAPAEPHEPARAEPVLAPRALADLHWAGRYAERAEDLVRLVLTAHANAEVGGGSTTAGVVGSRLQAALESLAGPAAAHPAGELRSLLLDAGRTGSAAHSLERLRDALEGVRDQLSGDTWRALGIIDRAMATLRASRDPGAWSDSAGRMLTGILALQGVTANMIRDTGWHMIELGRFLERAMQLCRLLLATTGGSMPRPAERAVLVGVLAAAESSVTYRRRHRGDERMPGVLELLLLDDGNPRSVASCLDEVRTHLAALPGSTGTTRPERLLAELRERVAELDPVALATPTATGRPGLEAVLADLLEGIGRLADALEAAYFRSGPGARPISALRLDEVAEA